MPNTELLKEVETFMLKRGRIYFEGWTFNNVDLRQFIIDIHDLQKVYRTVPEIIGAYKVTDQYRDRSFRDQFLLCNFYFNCTLHDFLTIITDLGPVGHMCHNIELLILSIKAVHPDWKLFNDNFVLRECNGRTFNNLLEAT